MKTIKSDVFWITEHLIYFGVISIISIINIVIFSLYWITNKRNQIGILKALGYSNRDTSILIRNELFILSLIASIISTIIYYPFSEFFNDKFFDIGLIASPIIFIADIVFLIICSLLVVAFNKGKIDKLTIGDNIRNHINFSKLLWVKLVLIAQVVLVLNYSVSAFDNFDYVFSTVNKAKTIMDIKNAECIDPFTVSYDESKLLSYDLEKSFKDLKQEDMILINYLYSSDSSKEVAMMKNKMKEEQYESNYFADYILRDNKEDVLPLIYIEKDSFKGINLKVYPKGDLGNNVSKTNIPVYAGSDYKKYFSVGDKINGDSGYSYGIIGFLPKDRYMFAENSGSNVLSDTNNLNSFFIIPYDLNTIKNLPPGYTRDDFVHYSMTNTFFKYNSEKSKKVVHSMLNSKEVKTNVFNMNLETLNTNPWMNFLMTLPARLVEFGSIYMIYLRKNAFISIKALKIWQENKMVRNFIIASTFTNIIMALFIYNNFVIKRYVEALTVEAQFYIVMLIFVLFVLNIICPYILILIIYTSENQRKKLIL